MICGVVAVEKNNGIGLDGFLPWPKLHDDLRFFKALTSGHVVIMGSNTWRSLSNILENRINIVLSKTTDYSNQGEADHTFSDLDTALVFCQTEYQDKNIFIIGGEDVYNQCLDKIERFYITEIDHDYPSDRFFNMQYVRDNFSKINQLIAFSEPVPFKITEYIR